MTDRPRISRAALARAGSPLPAPPVRIVHLGVGAFHRAHQAWYTAHAGDATEWGIAAFTGRRDTVARQLGPQDGVFTLVERGPEADRHERIGSIAEVHSSERSDRFLHHMAAPATAVVTLTVTEAGYHLRPDGALDLDDPDVAHDVSILRTGADQGLRTPTARLLVALDRRRRAAASALTVVPCDNLPANGARLQAAIETLAAEAGRDLEIGDTAFVTTSVDRITPHTTTADITGVERATGWHDEGVVVTEPFADWTLCGRFAGDRPDWESAGARFVADIEPYERRKLLILNGGHLVLAFRGLALGHATVAQAMADPACRRELDAFWDEAARAVGPEVDAAAYRAALVARFENRRIEHRLAQIAVDTLTKIRLRIIPVFAHERAAGRSGDGSLGVLRAWTACLRTGLVGDVGDAHPGQALGSLLDGTDPSVASDIHRALSIDPGPVVGRPS